ncbi:hypothetical protein ELQ90_15425, partial [Labedella phragmitis]
MALHRHVLSGVLVRSLRRFWFLLVAFVAVTALVAEVSVSFIVTPASAAEWADPDSLPLVDSPELELPGSEMPDGDFTDPPARDVEEIERVEPADEPTEFDSDVSEIVDREEFEQTYVNPDGTKTTELSTVPLNVELEDGTFVPVDTTLSGDGFLGAFGVGTVTAERHPQVPTFAEHADDDRPFTLTNDEYTIAFELEGSAHARVERNLLPVGDRSTITYPDVEPGVDLTYEVTKTGVKELLVLEDEEAADDGRWTWTVDADGLAVEMNEDGAVVFVDDDDFVQFLIPPAVMWDASAVEGEREAADSPVDMAVDHVAGSTWEIDLIADLDWLEDEDRVYPVWIDPTTSTSQEDVRAFRSDGATRHYGNALVGNSRSDGNTFWRSVVRYDFSKFFGKQVLDAQVCASYAGEGTTNLFKGALRHATGFSYSSTGEALSNFNIGADGCGAGQVLKERIAQWVRESNPDPRIMLSGTESSEYTYKLLATSLYVSWKDFPKAGAAKTPANNATNVSLVPLLSLEGHVKPPEADGMNYNFRVWQGETQVYGSGWIGQDKIQVPQFVLAANTKYTWQADVRDTLHGWLGTSTQRATPRATFTTGTPPTPVQSSAVPADDAVVVTTTPTLSITPGAGANANTRYWFRVATGTDAKSGQLLNSGWRAATSWTLPKGSLEDGGVYSWAVLVTHNGDEYQQYWVNSFRVDKRIGDAGPAPSESVGPATVNLANGNLGLQFTSPTVDTVGGPMGLGFTYNSMQEDRSGLKAEYFDVSPASGQEFTPPNLTGRTPVLVRTDANVSFDWNSSAAGPSLKADYFAARWTGLLTVPEPGSYQFGVASDDGARVSVDGQQVYDKWTAPQGGTLNWGSSKTLTGDPVPFSASYFDKTANASIELWVKKDGGAQTMVPADWFSKKVETLPPGWSSSAALAGEAGYYMAASVTTSAVILTDITGAKHTYKKRSVGGYTPPAGEYGVVALDSKARVTFTEEDGTVTVFNSAGKVAAVTGPADAKKPATPVITYREGTTQVDRVSDPLSEVSPATSPRTFSREVRFVYGGDTVAEVGLSPLDGSSGGSACLTPSGFAAAPVGMLCRIIYPGHAAGADDTTQLFYDASERLVRMVDPGAEVVSFEYDAAGRMTSVRDSLANDWLLADSSRVASSTNAATFAYDSAGRVASVALPAPDGTTAEKRPQTTFTYQSGKTFVDEAGATVPTAAPANGHGRTVTFDAAYRVLTDTSATGLTSSVVWNAEDQQLSSTDPNGRMTTNIYNAQDRVVANYGPAPASCFGADRKPTTACAAVPHSTTTYDNGLSGLAATYWNNRNFSGIPETYSLGIGHPTGALSKDWLLTGPPGVNTDEFSVRLTGLVTFPAAATYTFKTFADDGTRLWIDDLLIVDEWGGGEAHWSDAGTFTAKAGQQARIRIDYFDATSTARLELQWAAGTAALSVVPGSALSPDYGLVATSTVNDSAAAPYGGAAKSLSTSMAYQYPWLGAATSATVDPSGLALTSSATYETLGSGYLRRLSSTMPSGTGSASTSAYYGDTQTLQAVWGGSVCGLPASTPQFGNLKSTTGPTPAVGSAVTTQFVYDLMGRAVGVKRSGDTSWTCTVYDVRGREASTTFSAYGDEPARTVTNGFSSTGTASGDPLTTWTEDPAGRTTTKVDLLGQAVSYTDVWGTATTAVYDRLGRITETSTTAPNGGSRTQSFEYDADGKTERVLLDGKPIADPSYTAGEVTGVVFPGGADDAGNGVSLTNVTRNQTGASTGVTWTFPNGQAAVRDAVVRAQSGRIVANTVTDGSTSETTAYTYDGAGRLLTATGGVVDASYSFAKMGGCGAAPTAGANGNRTSSVVNGVSTTYCYDNADRLTSTTVTGAPEGASGVSSSLASIGYDAHGNTVTLSDQSLVYDVADRHVETNLADGTSIRYTRDASDRIVERRVSKANTPDVVTRFGFSGASDSPDLVLDGDGAVIERTLGLPGGVLASFRPDGSETWAFPNLHGDIVVTTDGAGVRQGARAVYDPFGQPVDPVTGAVGTAAADDAVPDTVSETDAD